MSTRILSRLQPPDTSYWAIIKLSLPVWISNVAIVGGATLDTLMTGHLGSTDLAAVAIGLAVSVSVFVALVGVMQGLSPIAGHHYGAGHHEKIGVTRTYQIIQAGHSCRTHGTPCSGELHCADASHKIGYCT